MNDELWNLMPMESSLNSVKSNKLPKWDPFFGVFWENQYLMYQVIQEKEELHKRFEACYRDNLHSIWAGTGRGIQEKSSVISCGKICGRFMIRQEGRGMRFGIIFAMASESALAHNAELSQ